MNKHLKYLLFVSVLLSACSNTKYLAPGQKLYLGANVKIDNKDIKKSDAKEMKTDLESLLRPAPNGAI